MKSFFIRTFALAWGLSVASLSTSPAQAHEFQRRSTGWVPPMVEVDLSNGHTRKSFCDGKYEAVASHLHHFDFNAYVDVYRLSRGLPKLTPAKESAMPRVLGRPGYGFYTRGETRLRDALLLFERSQTHLSPEAVFDYFLTLNINTHGGETLDWWLTAEPREDFDPAGCNFYRGANRRRLPCGGGATLARKQTAFDWLMTAHQLERARVYWLGKAKSWPDQVAHIFDHVDVQSQKRPGVNIWMAQYYHHKLFGHTVPDDIANRAQDAVTRITSCQASPIDYAIIAVGDLGLPREYLPKGLAELRTRRDIHMLTYKALSEGNGLDAAYYRQLRSLADQLEEKAWATSFLFLSAPDIETAVEIYHKALVQEKQDPAYNTRFYGRGTTGVKSLIFSLPTEAIPNSVMQFAQALSEEKMDMVARLEGEVLSVTRSIRQNAKDDAKRRVELAKRYSKSGPRVEERQKKLDIEVAKLAQLEAVESSNLPIRMRAALMVIEAEASHNFDRHNLINRWDIYPEQSQSEFLDIYIRQKLFPGIVFNPLVRGRGAHKSPKYYLDEERASNAVVSLPPLRKNNGSPEVGLAAIIDWEKLESFGRDKRLTRTVAINIFEWLNAASENERRENAHLVAPALYDTIRAARFQEVGQYKGAPIQKRAFEYLHKHYAQTEAAKNTAYWWPSNNRGHVPF